MILKNSKINKIVKDEDGSSMVEFALVLPLLIVLTLGGVYLSVSFGQKSIMNGLAFMETRAASVRKEHSDIAKHAVDNYIRDTAGKQKWVEGTKSEIFDSGQNDIKIVVSKDAMNLDILANSLSILGGKKPDGHADIKKIKSFMVLPVEYIAKAKGSDRPITSTVVHYETNPIGGDFLETGLFSKVPQIKSLLGLQSMVDPRDDTPGTHSTRRADQILGADKTNNMESVKKLYLRWGLDPNYNPNIGHPEEAPEGGLSIDSLNLLRVTGENIKLLEVGAAGCQYLIKTTVGPVVDTVLAPVKSVGAAVLPKVATVGDKFADLTEKNNNRLFSKNVVGN